MSCQTALVSMQQQVEDLDLSSLALSSLALEEQGQVRYLLHQYVPVFSTREGHLGCTSLTAHDIPLGDDVPVKQRYRDIPPQNMR